MQDVGMSCGDVLWPLQARDYQDAWIRWDRAGYERHVAKRPETAGWHQAIGQTLADPDLVVELPGGGTGHYRQGVVTGKQRNCFLYVIVRWYGALGDIATAFPVTKTQPYERLVRFRK